LRTQKKAKRTERSEEDGADFQNLSGGCQRLSEPWKTIYEAARRIE